MFICDICNREFKSIKGLNAHKGHHNPEFEKKFQERMKILNKDRSELSRNIMNKMWKDPNFREKKSESAKSQWTNEFREKRSKEMSKHMKERWSNKEYRDKMSEIVSSMKTYSDEDWIKKLEEYNIKDFKYISSKNDGRNTWVELEHTCGSKRFVRSEQLSRYHSCTCYSCNPMGSIQEQELRDYITSLGYTAEKLCRSTERIYELDIYIPELKIAFEYNGLYWHCGKNRPHNYHRNKVNWALQNNILLFNLWEHWSIDKCKDIISSKLGLVDKIGARKCSIEKIDVKTAKEFLEKYHVEGYTRSHTRYGMYYNGELISVLTLRGDLEIARFATKANTQVFGGLSKFISRIKEDFSGILYTYTDRDLCPDYHNSCYYKVGFEFLGDSGPTLKYYDVNKHVIYQRQELQKYKLKNIFPDVYDDSLTEQQILEKVGIYTLENSGDWKFKINL